MFPPKLKLIMYIHIILLYIFLRSTLFLNNIFLYFSGHITHILEFATFLFVCLLSRQRVDCLIFFLVLILTCKTWQQFCVARQRWLQSFCRTRTSFVWPREIDRLPTSSAQLSIPICVATLPSCGCGELNSLLDRNVVSFACIGPSSL